ncbi:DNA ligase D [Allorhizobium taibaishanense]|uniref:DNA ligase (ATP) n=1 Tax=Allorhizobium taibaishanense TaxID=887144 RepID=A0A1Q9A6P8_9HYPH|nr:DNA ligase D [Allorhizobium taibaishanense]MBB4008601.1 bifunctional non-homologous end joining protein LigD [Allorhizobium taibaishanense]OLP50257.1 DNA ligase [Allorhizobium taibaishanense]
MSLKRYNEKRHFDRSPEPKGEAGDKGGHLFVVQKHDARRLHYDFRLEMDGVLKSWAVTRGPSLDPAEKRLAVHVEDHPISYGDFEGTIPKGEYGGGTVILWDTGKWSPIGDVHKAYKKGHLEFELDGDKLKGRWHLVRMHGKPEEKRENWLLIKGEDEIARSEGDILEELPLSVKTGRSIAEVRDHPDAIWHSGKKGGSKTSKPAATSAKRTSKAADASLLKGAKKAALPDFVEPALARLKAKPPAGEKWLHEIKFDGYRLQARIDNKNIKLLTRSGLDWTEKFGADIAEALAELSLETALIDGELVVEKASGASDFSALQQDLSEKRSDRFVFYAFDLLYLDGHDLRNVPLIDRKARLETLLPPDSSRLRYSAHFNESGGMVLDHACRLSLEGVISKDRNSRYVSGRGRSWVKSKCSQRQEFVIGGFTISSVSDQAIGSLALGVYEDGKLRHVGRVGTGFSQQTAERLHEKLAEISQTESPFDGKLSGDARRGLIYVAPELVAEVEFRSWSGDGNLRHAAFRGLREDKPAGDVIAETDHKASKTSDGKAAALPRTSVTFTHPDRLYWPKDGVTKTGLADYYAQVWHLMAPYVVDRPLALVRCPDGIEGQRFFQKHAWRGINKHIDQIRDPKDKQGAPLLRIMDFDGLMALVQSAALEIHPWGATTKALETPDMITMDLDPAENVAWSQVIEAAFDLKAKIEADGLAAFVKTSGGKGLHVVIPLKPRARWPAVKAYAKRLAEDLSRENPQRYLSVATKAKRDGRIFIDYLRNGRGNTAVVAYGARAREGAAVSMPLDWSELTDAIGPAYFTLENIQARLAAMKADPWEDFFAAAKPLP